jgi:hypothetical protein
MAGQARALASPCKDLEQDLVLLHYGDLGEVERDAAQRHVKACAGCAAYLDELDKLLPLTIKSDAPEHSFWNDYSRELRQKLDAAAERKFGWQSLAVLFRPRLISAFAGAAVIAVALVLTLDRGVRPFADLSRDEEAILEVMPLAENLEFFKNMELLDDLDLLENMTGPGNAA